MKLFLKLSLFLIAFSYCLTSFSMTVSEAKRLGYVVEGKNGYLVLSRTDATGEAKDLVKEINAKRKKVYISIAEKNGVDLAKVEKQMGEKNASKK